MPTSSIPISLGNVVNEMSHPPKLAATVSTTKPKSLPPGAAVSPIITNAVTQHSTPAGNCLHQVITSEQTKINCFLYLLKLWLIYLQTV